MNPHHTPGRASGPDRPNPIRPPVDPQPEPAPGGASTAAPARGTSASGHDEPPDAEARRAEPDERSAALPATEHPAARLAAQALGATVGALGGAVAGSVVGIAAGPVGSLAGAAAGAAIGGMAGAGAGIDTAGSGPAPGDEDEVGHWREAFTEGDYITDGTHYEDWEPAFRYGAVAYQRHAPMVTWSEAEGRLGLGWDDARGASPLPWSQARHAAHDAWEYRKAASRRA